MPNLQNVAKGLQSTLGSMTYAASLLQIVREDESQTGWNFGHVVRVK